jgi:hypothetical protein
LTLIEIWLFFIIAVGTEFNQSGKYPWSYLDYVTQPVVLKLGFLRTAILDKFIHRSSLLPKYYARNENLWVDGFLFDFLQKKTLDSWVRQWVIYTGFLFSERLVFDAVVRIYLDNVIWPLHDKSIFEASNVSEMLSTVMFLYFTILLLFYSVYIIYLF